LRKERDRVSADGFAMGGQVLQMNVQLSFDLKCKNKVDVVFQLIGDFSHKKDIVISDPI